MIRGSLTAILAVATVLAFVVSRPVVGFIALGLPIRHVTGSRSISYPERRKAVSRLSAT
jgi:hypothetical protein